MLVSFNACRQEAQRHLSIEPVTIVAANVPTTALSGDSLVVEVTCGTPTPCWEFHRYAVARSDSGYSIVVYAEYDGRPCIQIPGTFTTRITIAPPGPGRYVFTFNQEEGRVLRKSLIVR